MSKKSKLYLLRRAEALYRVKQCALKFGWRIVEKTRFQILLQKTEFDNRYVAIEGEMWLLYNAREHSMTSTLWHENHGLKTLKRYLKPDLWGIVERLIGYPRTHDVGDSYLRFEFLDVHLDHISEGNRHHFFDSEEDDLADIFAEYFGQDHVIKGVLEQKMEDDLEENHR